MPDDTPQTKLAIGVVFSAREIEIEVPGDPADVEKGIREAIEGGDRVLSLDAEGKRVIIPTDKLAYIEIIDGKKSSSIGFGN